MFLNPDDPSTYPKMIPDRATMEAIQKALAEAMKPSPEIAAIQAEIQQWRSQRQTKATSPTTEAPSTTVKADEAALAPAAEAPDDAKP